jgi:hypothetical protein
MLERLLNFAAAGAGVVGGAYSFSFFRRDEEMVELYALVKKAGYIHPAVVPPTLVWIAINILPVAILGGVSGAAVAAFFGAGGAFEGKKVKPADKNQKLNVGSIVKTFAVAGSLGLLVGFGLDKAGYQLHLD